jgi:glycine cleavage system T protein (aminomethyltransferase)
MSELKNTPLHDLHLELGAKMVPFAGFNMPLQYRDGIIAEHQHCRHQAGFFDISHMGQCQVHSLNAAQRLETLTPSAISKLKPGQQRYSVLTNAEGGIIDDIIISRLDDSYLLVVNAACKTKDYTHLQHHFGTDFTEWPNQALFALQGPSAHEVIQELSPVAARLTFLQLCQTTIRGIDCIISRSGYTGEDGFEISLPAEQAMTLAKTLLAFDQVKPIGLGARDTLRLEAGLSLYGHELSESTTPVEAGLRWIIAKDNDSFPGAKLIHQQLEQGAPRKRVGLLVDGKIPVREHCELLNSNDIAVGSTTSGSFSPSLGKPIALALIDSSCQEHTLYAKVRNRQISLHVSPLPFVPHRYYRG